MKDLCAVGCTDSWDQVSHNKEVISPFSYSVAPDFCLQEALGWEGGCSVFAACSHDLSILPLGETLYKWVGEDGGIRAFVTVKISFQKPGSAWWGCVLLLPERSTAACPTEAVWASNRAAHTSGRIQKLACRMWMSPGYSLQEGEGHGARQEGSQSGPDRNRGPVSQSSDRAATGGGSQLKSQLVETCWPVSLCLLVAFSSTLLVKCCFAVLLFLPAGSQALGKDLCQGIRFCCRAAPVLGCRALWVGGRWCSVLGWAEWSLNTFCIQQQNMMTWNAVGQPRPPDVCCSCKVLSADFKLILTYYTLFTVYVTLTWIWKSLKKINLWCYQNFSFLHGNILPRCGFCLFLSKSFTQLLSNISTAYKLVLPFMSHKMPGIAFACFLAVKWEGM